MMSTNVTDHHQADKVKVGRNSEKERVSRTTVTQVLPAVGVTYYVFKLRFPTSASALGRVTVPPSNMDELGIVEIQREASTITHSCVSNLI